MEEENKRYDYVEDVEISKEMRTAFLDYSMSVIVSRALPDVRDGMKPVHRRILHAMNQLGITSGVAHKRVHVLLVKLLVSITLMGIQLYMMRWFVWPRISLIDIH